MGWCSATDIFDTVCKGLLTNNEEVLKDTIKKLIIALEEIDWDCQQDSVYFDHPLVGEIFRELHSDWFE